MPIFEYSCMNCHHNFEKLQKFGDALPAECPACGSDQIKKELSVFASTGNVTATADCSIGG